MPWRIGPTFLALALVACEGRERPSVPPPPSSAPAASASSAAPLPAKPPPEAEARWPLPASLQEEHRELAAAVRKGIPAESGDYAEALAAVMLVKRKRLTVAELGRVLAEGRLSPHRLGDAYLLMPSPTPPPGVDFDPAMMPPDWEGTWGEVAMAYHLGELTRAQYDALHRAAHPQCPR